MSWIREKTFLIIKALFPKFMTSKMLINHLKDNGVKVGKGTFVFDCSSVKIDCSRGELLEIGEYVKITGGVVILTHDYSRSVLRRKYGEIIGEAKTTHIGDNSFIGMNSIILMGSHIGKNCIIGAGSIVRGEIPDNSVAAGNPAKVIMSINEYYKKRKKEYIKEAKNYAKIFYEKHKRVPTINDMGSFFPLYLDRNVDEIRKNRLRTKLNGDEEDQIIDKFLNSKKIYNSYEDFLKDCHLL